MDIIKPKHIEPGATIGVVSPSSAVSREALEQGLQVYRARGYRIEYGESVYSRWGYFAGEDKARAEDLMSMFQREDIDAVICSRGGYGAARLIPYLDVQVFKDNPKLFIGYSDITVLHQWLFRHVGLTAYYAPMPITFSRPVPQVAEEQMWSALESNKALGALPSWKTDVKTLKGGKARGKVLGGCLCLMSYAVGTPAEIDYSSAIVLIEDVDEPPYRIDEMLTQMLLAGKFNQTAAFVIGEDTRWEKHIDPNAPDSSFTPEEIWMDRLGGFNVPIICGFPFGHQTAPLTLPLGITAELDADAGTLTYLESACE